ncbi:MAG: HupE/UreJ family protein [Acidimicrobiales bacterium]
MKDISIPTARMLAASLIALATFLTLVPSAQAHSIDQSYLYFDILPDAIEGRLELRVSDINEVLGLDIVEAGDNSVTGLEANADTIEAYIRQHMFLREGASEWQYSFTDEITVLDTDTGTFGQFHFVVDEAFDDIPRAWDVELDVFFEQLPDNQAFVLIASYWDGGVFNNEADFLSIFKADDTIQPVTIDEPSFWAGLKSTIDLGILHIRIGTDHILFILVLVLPSVLVFSSKANGWQPGQSFRSSLWKVLKIATMFTIAHSITLSLAGLGLLGFPSRPVEALIALSIVVAALHNLRPIFHEKEWLIAFGFGIFHGLGFAGLLDGLGLDKGRKIWSLLGFNIGVEIGQAVIIMLVFPILFMLRRTRIYEPLMRLASIAMAIIATNWFVERIFGFESGLGSIVDKLLKFPRVLAPLAIAALAAGGWFLWERHRDALLAIPEPTDPQTSESVLV